MKIQTEFGELDITLNAIRKLVYLAILETYGPVSISTENWLSKIVGSEESRVKIQEEKPEQKEPYNLIDYVQFIDSNENFTNEKIYLNQNLNVIIGGKSTGKSILLREIARTINPYEVKNRLEEASAFHFSGFLDSEIFKDFDQKGWARGSIHPNLSFADEENALKYIKTCCFGIEGNREGLLVAKQIVEKISNCWVEIPYGSKGAYHLAAVIASNFNVEIGRAHV